MREDHAGCVQTQKNECKSAASGGGGGGVAAIPAVAKHKWVSIFLEKLIFFCEMKKKIPKERKIIIKMIFIKKDIKTRMTTSLKAKH